MIFDDIFGGFVTLFSDSYAIWFVILASFVGIVFGALPGLTAAAAIAMMTLRNISVIPRYFWAIATAYAPNP